MNNITNIYDIDGELIREAGDNHEMTIEEAQEQLKKYEEKVKELSENEPDSSKIAVYNDYIKNLASYILTLYAKQPKQAAPWHTSEELGMKEQIEKAMNELQEEVAKEEKEEESKSQGDFLVEREEPVTVMDEYVPFVEVDENTKKEPLPFSEIDKVIAA